MPKIHGWLSTFKIRESFLHQNISRYTGMVTVDVNLVTKDDHKIIITLGVVSAGGGGGVSGGGHVTTSAGTTASASAPPSNEEALLSK